MTFQDRKKSGDSKKSDRKKSGDNKETKDDAKPECKN